ncbi:MAG: NusG domain II-containing protein [Thiohalomonadales bacterium]
MAYHRNHKLHIIPSRGDYLVFFLALLIVSSSFFYFWRPNLLADYAEVRINGKFLQRVDLYQEQTLNIVGKLGTSVISISHGKIRFLDSPCTSKQCIHQGWLAHAGEFAACLPNQISINIDGPDPQYDSINF